MDRTGPEDSKPARAAFPPPRMEDDVHILVLAPFLDIVEKGKIAMRNSKDAEPPLSEDMCKTAQKLVQEGERAVKRIEPLCKKHLEEYGANFVNALKENDDIANFRTELNDLLWDFDSFIEAEDFEADEFAKLRALSRKCAPRIYDILMRMKLEPLRFTSGFTSATISRAVSVAGLSDGHPTGAQQEREGPTHESDAAVDLHPNCIAGTQAGPDLGLDGESSHQSPEWRAPEAARPPSDLELPTAQLRSAESVGPEEIPPEPPDNPWQLVQLPVLPTEMEDYALGKGYERRGRVPSGEGSQPEVFSPQLGRVDELVGGEARRLNSLELQNLSASPVESRSGGYGRSNNEAVPGTSEPDGPQPGPISTARPGSETRASLTGAPFANGQQLPAIATYIPHLPPQRYSQASLSSSAQPSLIDSSARDSTASLADHSPPAAGPYSFQSAPESRPDMSSGWPISAVPHHVVQTPLRVSLDQPGLEPVPGGPSSGQALPPMPTREPDCSINIDSSFYQFKGFCDGAKDIIRGGAGVKKIRKPGMGAGTAVVAKCKSCMFELDWKLVEADVNMANNSNYMNTGVGFRLRFLSKSHIAAKNVDNELYGCLFCVQLGRTTEESDATVFFTQKQLFAHLTRHPRPLPAVPGLTVIEATQVPPQLMNNFDLHFLNPPARSVMAGLERLLAAMPTAVATETFRKTNNAQQRHPPDGQAVLQFAAGARIVGVEFPARYGGEWAVGWADNVRAAFPADCARLVAPDQSQVRAMQANGGSNLRAVARWRGSRKDKDSGRWLRFDAGEVITGIGFPYVEDWCWSGYNSKQKWGLFPQSHIEPGTLSEAPPPPGGRQSRTATGEDRASIHSDEGKRVSGILAKLSSVRHRDARPAGSVESRSSGDALY